MRWMRDKRGEEEGILFVLELVIPVIIGSILLAWVINTTTDQLYTQQYTVRETALTASAVSAAPGNIWYEQTVNKSFISFGEKIDMHFKHDNFHVYYPYRLNNNQEKLSNTPSELSKVFYSKTPEQLRIGATLEFSPSLYACADSFVPKIQSLVIDPIQDTTDVQDKVLGFSNNVAASMKINVRDIQLARDAQGRMPVLPPSDATVGIRLIDDPSLKKSVAIQYSLVQSNSFACMLANAGISAKLPSFLVSQEIDPSLAQDPSSIFARDGRTAMVTAINLDQEEIQMLAAAIAEGVKDYNDHP